MSMLNILLHPDPRLKRICEPVARITPEVETLAADMLATMYDAPGVGLAAPQVGVLQQLAVGVAHLADLPAALAFGLQQEHVVVVEVRADAAAGRGEADHQVVDTPAGQEAEVLEHFGHFRHELVDGLHQQGPVAFGQLAEGVLGERAAAQFPRVGAVLQHQARFDFLFQRQAGQFVGADRAFEAGDGLTDQQGLLLPVVAQELARSEAAQQLQRSIRIHG